MSLKLALYSGNERQRCTFCCLLFWLGMKRGKRKGSEKRDGLNKISCSKKGGLLERTSFFFERVA